jgi:hypothetical protein
VGGAFWLHLRSKQPWTALPVISSRFPITIPV